MSFQNGNNPIKKVTLICGCLESGKDGVGDYVRGLSASLQKLGVETLCISISDKYLKSSFMLEEGNLLRISSETKWVDKVRIVKKYIHSFKPDITSLQFVPYSFNSKGIFIKEIKYIDAMFKGLRSHVMFHELWLVPANFKEKVLSKLQKLSTLTLVRKLNPAFIQTSNKYYQHRLEKANIEAHIFPIFSNIPNLQEGAEPFLFSDSNQYPIFIMFGNIPLTWNFKPLLDRVAATYEEPLFVALGNLRRGEKIWHEMKNEYSKKITFLHYSNLKPLEISQMLKSAHFAVTGNQEKYLRKSGSVAAFLEHGLPIIFPKSSNEAFPIDKNLPFYSLEDVDKLGFDKIYKNTNHKITRNPGLEFLKELEKLTSIDIDLRNSNEHK